MLVTSFHSHRQAVLLSAAALLPLVAFLYLSTVQLNHDVAWLLEATGRWMDGAELYRDIVEINPPLIFFDNLILTAGQLTKQSYLAGACLAATISAFWVARWHGALAGLFASASLILAGISDFGQRDHLALIFLAPFVLAPSELGRRERLLLGAWAFLGVGLKPHFAIIAAAFIIARKAYDHVPVWRSENVMLGGLCAGLILLTAIAWPQYFTEIVPLGRLVYAFYEGSAIYFDLALSALAMVTGAVAMLQRRPIGAAVVGAVLVYVIQGKFWHYQLIPALGLGAMAGLAGRGPQLLAGIMLLTASPILGPNRYSGPAIPGAQSVLFLSDRVSVAYPRVFECSTVNASRYPTFWTLPGAWRSGNLSLFRSEVANLNADVGKWRPEVIYNDQRLYRFNSSFNFKDWVDLTNYRKIGMDGNFEIWLRRDLAPSILIKATCEKSQ